MPLSIRKRALHFESKTFFYWPGGNSEAKVGQEMDGYRQDMADVGWNAIRVAAAWKMPAPIGPVTKEDFLPGAQKQQRRGWIFV